MSRVYTDSVLKAVASGTAAYIDSFAKALSQTRIDVAPPVSFGGSLLDYFLNEFGTSDPFTVEEMEITATWAVSDNEQWSPGNTALHRIPPSFESEWPPPQIWVETQDWNPLSQSNPRHTEHGTFRTRK